MFNVRQANSCCCNCQKIWQLFGVQSLVHSRISLVITMVFSRAVGIRPMALFCLLRIGVE